MEYDNLLPQRVPVCSRSTRNVGPIARGMGTIKEDTYGATQWQMSNMRTAYMKYSGLSDFLRNAPEKKKIEVFTEAARRANETQRKMCYTKPVR